VGGWAGLARFWIAVLTLLVLGAGLLQSLGPPERAPQIAHSGVQPPRAEKPAEPIAIKPVPSRPANAPGRATPGPIAEPDPALSEPSPDDPAALLPRIAPDGRAPMQVYAAGFDRTTRRAPVGLIVAGIGMNHADSLAAIRALPAGITLAVSPFAADLAEILSAARTAEHEYLVSIPMEPEGFPLNDPDSRRALMTSRLPEENVTALRWALSRFAGYVGATSVLGPLRGERLTGVPDQMEAVFGELSRRGLLYVGTRPGVTTPGVWSQRIDMTVDDISIADVLDARLSQLAQLAQDRNGALGLVTVPRPVTVDRVAAWANGLVNRGLILAPVSALAQPPEKDKSR
jgi:uncharacterized protein